MAIAMPFKREERLPTLRRATEKKATQVQRAVGALEQRLPGRRSVSWWERPVVKSLVVLSLGAIAAAVATVLLRRESDASDEYAGEAPDGLVSTRTELYDTLRAEEATAEDSVREAEKESFPASDAPGWSNGPDVPIIREGEHKDALPYQQR